MITKDLVLKHFYYKDGCLFNKTDRNYNCQKGQRVGSVQGDYPYTYRILSFNGKMYKEHRLIFLMHHGWLPRYIDHISDDLTEDGIKSNKIENLRAVTNSSNCQKGRARKNTSSKYRGVSYRKSCNKYFVTISHKCKSIYLGIYSSEIEAAKVYDEKAYEYHGEYAGLNFPEDYNKFKREGKK